LTRTRERTKKISESRSSINENEPLVDNVDKYNAQEHLQIQGEVVAVAAERKGRGEQQIEEMLQSKKLVEEVILKLEGKLQIDLEEEVDTLEQWVFLVVDNDAFSRENDVFENFENLEVSFWR
jgi:uncharacterized protein YecA (UPF0149 family)